MRRGDSLGQEERDNLGHRITGTRIQEMRLFYEGGSVPCEILVRR